MPLVSSERLPSYKAYGAGDAVVPVAARQSYFDYLEPTGRSIAAQNAANAARISAENTTASGEIIVTTEQQVTVGEGAGQVAAAANVAVPDLIGALELAPAPAKA